MKIPCSILEQEVLIRKLQNCIVTGAKLEHICDLMKDEAAEKIAKEALEEVI